MKKQILILMLVIFLAMPLISAEMYFDNIKGDLIIDETTSKYGKIEIKDWFGLLDYASIEPKINTDICGSDCSAGIEIIMYQDGILIEDIKFVELIDGKWIDSSINSYEFYVKTGGTEWLIDDFEYECTPSFTPNLTATETCTQVKTGEHYENDYTYRPYTLGEEVTGTSKGTKYYVKLEGRKRQMATVDWQLTVGGKLLDEFTVWGATLLQEVLGTSTTQNGQNVIGIFPWVAMNFTATNNYSVRIVRVFIASDGGLSSNTNVGIYPVNVTTNAVIDSIIGSNSSFVSSFSAGSAVNFTWSLNDTNVTAGVKYALIFWASGSGDFVRVGELTGTDGFSYHNCAGGAITQCDFDQDLTVRTMNIRIYGAEDETILDSEVFTTLNSPVDFFNSSASSVEFNCSANTTSLNGEIMTNISLWLNQTGTWILNETEDVSGTFNNSVFTKNIPDGLNYEWTCRAFDNRSASDWGTNRTFSVDTVNPQLIANISNPIIFNDGDDVRINYTATDTNLQNCWHNYDGTNTTFACVSGVNDATNITSVSPATQIIIYVNDSFGRENSTTLNFAFDSTSPIITINLPKRLEDFGYVGKPETLNWSVFDASLGSVWYNYNGTNFTLNGAANFTTFFLKTSPFNLTVWANDTIGNQNSSLRIWTYKIFNNSENRNDKSFETASETFIINVTANSSLTEASLIYKGTVHEAIQDGLNWTVTIDIPLGTANNEFFWNFTYAGSGITSTSQFQTVNFTNFSICGGNGGTVSFINYTFADESNGTAISAEMTPYFAKYWLGSGTIFKTLTFTNNTENLNYSFCAVPADRELNIAQTIQYLGANYPQRIFNLNETISNTTTTRTLYLLDFTRGLFTTYATINSLTGSAVTLVSVTVQTDILGIPTTVTQGFTDATGLITMWLNPDNLHSFSFSKPRFSLNQFVIRPASPDIYQISMTPTEVEEVSNGTNVGVDLEYTIEPSQLTLEPNTTYTFSFNVSQSPAPNSTSMQLFSNTTLLFSGTQTGNGIISTTLFTGDNSSIEGVYLITTNLEVLELTKAWTVINVTSGDFSLDAWMNFGNELAINSLWWSLFRYVVIMALLIAVAGGFYYIDPFDSSIASLTVAIVVVWFFSSFRWLTINTPMPPSIDQYIISSLFTILMVAFIAWRYKTQ